VGYKREVYRLTLHKSPTQQAVGRRASVNFGHFIVKFREREIYFLWIRKAGHGALLRADMEIEQYDLYVDTYVAKKISRKSSTSPRFLSPSLLGVVKFWVIGVVLREYPSNLGTRKTPSC
jgi:hypothetical protein